MKQIVITGCTRGLGYCLLEQYLAEGWIVYPVVRSSAPIGHLMQRHSERCRPIVCDVAEGGAKDTVAASLRANGAKLQVLINNAGSGGGSESSIGEIDPSFLAGMLATHCMGAISVVQAALPFFERGSAKVVNVSSRLGSARRNAERAFAGLGFSYSYRVAKAAQNMATLCMSQDDAFAGITVCAMHPGKLKTDSGAFDADTEPAIAAKRMIRRIELINESDNGSFINLDGGALPW